LDANVAFEQFELADVAREAAVIVVLAFLHPLQVHFPRE